MSNYPDTHIALAKLFGREWLRLSESDRALIIRDVEDGVDDLAQYRRNIGTGNLEAYARTQRVRFAQFDGTSAGEAAYESHLLDQAIAATTRRKKGVR